MQCSELLFLSSLQIFLSMAIAFFFDLWYYNIRYSNDKDKEVQERWQSVKFAARA